MGRGYGFKCTKCKNEYSVMPGIGMMYPQVYQEAIKDIENGNYGAQWQQLINSEEYVAVNAERYIYLQ